MRAVQTLPPHLFQDITEETVVDVDETKPSGISGVVIPVWSEQNGQDDLVWHNATKQDDGSYKVTI